MRPGVTNSEAVGRLAAALAHGDIRERRKPRRPNWIEQRKLRKERKRKSLQRWLAREEAKAERVKLQQQEQKTAELRREKADVTRRIAVEKEMVELLKAARVVEVPANVRDQILNEIIRHRQVEEILEKARAEILRAQETLAVIKARIRFHQRVQSFDPHIEFFEEEDMGM